MFFKQKWQHFMSQYDFDSHVESNKLQTVSDIVNFIYDKEDIIKSSYNIFDHDYDNKKPTFVQRLNIVWFSIVFYFIIAPIHYVITGYKGVDERTTFGKWLTKLIGEYRVPKAWKFKGGWQKTLSKEEFSRILADNNIESVHDFRNFIFNDPEDRFCSYLIVENEDKLYNTRIQRFNRFWVYPILIPVSFVVAGYNYIRHGRFVFDDNEKMRPLLTKLLGE